MKKPKRQFNKAFRQEYKTAIDFLEQVDNVKAEIDYINRRITRVKEQMYSVKTSKYDSVVVAGGKNEAIINYLSNLEKYEQLITEKKTKLLQKINEIELTIDKINYPQGYMLKLYYIQDLNYERIAVKTFYSYNYVCLAIRQGIIDLNELLKPV